MDSCYCFIFTNFSAVVCPKLTVPDNGGVVPSLCSQTDVEYGTRCVFYCGDGYALSGPRYTTCQDDTSWSEIAPLSCVRGQFTYMQGGLYKPSQTASTFWSIIFSYYTILKLLQWAKSKINQSDCSNGPILLKNWTGHCHNWSPCIPLAESLTYPDINVS